VHTIACAKRVTAEVPLCTRSRTALVVRAAHRTHPPARPSHDMTITHAACITLCAHRTRVFTHPGASHPTKPLSKLCTHHTRGKARDCRGPVDPVVNRTGGVCGTGGAAGPVAQPCMVWARRGSAHQSSLLRTALAETRAVRDESHIHPSST
jgi:hypothetical protein